MDARNPGETGSPDLSRDSTEEHHPPTPPFRGRRERSPALVQPSREPDGQPASLPLSRRRFWRRDRSAPLNLERAATRPAREPDGQPAPLPLATRPLREPDGRPASIPDSGSRRSLYRLLLVAVTVLVVGVVLAGVLARQGGVVFGVSSANTGGGATATAGMASFRATATAIGTQPYQAPYPGFGESCSDTGPTATIWSTSANDGQVLCQSSGVRLVVSDPLHGYINMVFNGNQCQSWAVPPSCYWTFPPDWSFTITQLPGETSDSVDVSLNFPNGYSYDFEFLDSDGEWYVSVGGGASQLSGTFNATQANTLGMRLSGGMMSFLLNGQLIEHMLVPSGIASPSLAFYVNTQATLNDFVFTPLP